MSLHLRKKDRKEMRNKSSTLGAKHLVTRNHLPRQEHPVQPVVPVTSTEWALTSPDVLFAHLSSMNINTNQGKLMACQKPVEKLLISVTIPTPPPYICAMFRDDRIRILSRFSFLFAVAHPLFYFALLKTKYCLCWFLWGKNTFESHLCTKRK